MYLLSMTFDILEQSISDTVELLRSSQLQKWRGCIFVSSWLYYVLFEWCGLTKPNCFDLVVVSLVWGKCYVESTLVIEEETSLVIEDVYLQKCIIFNYYSWVAYSWFIHGWRIHYLLYIHGWRRDYMNTKGIDIRVFGGIGHGIVLLAHNRTFL